MIKKINERSLILRRKINEKIFEKISKKVLTNVKVRAIIYRSQQTRRQFGSIAQLGEHLPYKQRVIGSSPIVSTSAKAQRPFCDSKMSPIWAPAQIMAR